MAISKKSWVLPYKSVLRKVSGWDIENILIYWSKLFYPDSESIRNMTPKRERAIAYALYYSTPEIIYAVLEYAATFSIYAKKDISYILSEEVFLDLKEKINKNFQSDLLETPTYTDSFVSELD